MSSADNHRKRSSRGYAKKRGAFGSMARRPHISISANKMMKRMTIVDLFRAMRGSRSRESRAVQQETAEEE